MSGDRLKPGLQRGEGLKGEMISEAEARRAVEELSNRQRQVLRAVALGQSRKEIAANLGLSENTVDSYVKRLYPRLGVRGIAQATTVAVRSELIMRVRGRHSSF